MVHNQNKHTALNKRMVTLILLKNCKHVDMNNIFNYQIDHFFMITYLNIKILNQFNIFNRFFLITKLYKIF